MNEIFVMFNKTKKVVAPVQENAGNNFFKDRNLVAGWQNEVRNSPGWQFKDNNF